MWLSLTSQASFGLHVKSCLLAENTLLNTIPLGISVHLFQLTNSSQIIQTLWEFEEQGNPEVGGKKTDHKHVVKICNALT